MAKISARGATKVTEAHFDFTDSTSVVRYFYVLRSDGAILSANAWPNAESAYDRKRTGYSIAAKIKPGNDNLDVFNRYVNKRAARLGTVAVFK
jgi:hypothetical protein